MGNSWWARNAVTQKGLFTEAEASVLYEHGYSDQQIWAAGTQGWTMCQLLKCDSVKNPSLFEDLARKGHNLEVVDRSKAGYPKLGRILLV